MSTLNFKTSKVKQVFNSPDSLIFTSLSMMSIDKKSVIPEMIYTLDRESLTRLCSVYGGEKLYIPTPTEFKLYLSSSIAAYYKLVQRKPWRDIKNKLGLTDIELKEVKNVYKSWINNAPEEDINVLKIFKESGNV